MKELENSIRTKYSDYLEEDTIKGYSSSLENPFKADVPIYEKRGIQLDYFEGNPTKNFPYNKDTLFIKYLYIDETQRGQGIGSQIFDEIKQFADNNGLYIRLKNDKNFNTNFWEKKGFVIYEGDKSADYVYSRLDDYVLAPKGETLPVTPNRLDTPTNVVDYQDTGIGGRPLKIENGIPVDANSNPINSLGAADETITIYRVVPEGIDNVNANDWVFINKGQAEEGLKNVNTNSTENFKLIELEVSKGDVYPSAKGNLIMGYFPKDTPTNVVDDVIKNKGTINEWFNEAYNKYDLVPGPEDSNKTLLKYSDLKDFLINEKGLSTELTDKLIQNIKDGVFAPEFPNAPNPKNRGILDLDYAKRAGLTDVGISRNLFMMGGMQQHLDNIYTPKPPAAATAVSELSYTDRQPLQDNFYKSLKDSDDVVEIYLRQVSSVNVPAESVYFRPELVQEIPGLYTEPIGGLSPGDMASGGGIRPTENYYRLEVNKNNLLIDVPGFDFNNELKTKLDWNLLEKELGINYSQFEGTRHSYQSFHNKLNSLAQELGIDNTKLYSTLRKSGYEGTVGYVSRQIEVVLLDPNDDLGIGKNLNFENSTVDEFYNNNQTVNQLDELVIKPDTPTNVVDDGPALLETRIENKAKYDYTTTTLIPEWKSDVVKPNKIFAPNKFEVLQTYPDQTYSTGKEILKSLKAGTATDEDITRFFIYMASQSQYEIYPYHIINQSDAIADIVKIGIFTDEIPIKSIIPLGGDNPELEAKYNLVLDNNFHLRDLDRKIVLDMVNERGQFENLKPRMRETLLNAHKKIYGENPNDYFILWRGGDLSRFNTWQSMSKSFDSASGVMYQMKLSPNFKGGGMGTYVINKNNMLDLDALGLSHGREREVIVLTEAANKPGAKAPFNFETPQELRDYKQSWVISGSNTEVYPKQGFEITNTTKRLNELGQSTQNFFDDLISGMNPDLKPNKPYEQIIELNNPQLQNAQDIYNKYVAQGGDFNPHYFTSIPTIYETQIVKAQALNNMLDKHDKVINDTGTIKVLDIGGTEGVWGNTVAEIGGEKVYVEIIEPSSKANELYNKIQTPDNSRFRHEAFSYVIQDQGVYFNQDDRVKFAEFFAGGVKDERTKIRNPDVQMQTGKYDVVHEAMTFQFVDKNRQAQIDFIADYVLADDGILLIEEKFTNNDVIYQNNEKMKDDFKRLYYTEEQINSKYQNIVGPMGDKQVSVQEIENLLSNKFQYVNQYWDSGNFKGYIASNNPIAETFVDEIHLLDTSLTNHIYSTAPTQEELKYAVQKDMRNRGIDLELAKDFAKRFVDGNKQFIQSASDALGEVYKAGKAVAPAVGSLAIRGLSKAAPVLAPGDVLVEGALSKVTPYVDDFAKRLGFASLPVKQVLPTYIAADIGAAGAELVSAAMYAYDESQRKAPQQPSQFQESLTRFLLPKEYEEEAVQKLQIPQDLQSFYKTPAGQQFLKDNDFGSLFKKQLEQEKLTKYSPGWQLSKAIFSLFGSMSKEQANISEKTRGNMGQALLTGIGK